MPNSPRSASAAIAGRNGASSTIWEPMWKCKPSRSSLSEAMTRSIATGAASRLKPNFVFGPPVEIDGCVSGLTPGAIRIWTARRRPPLGRLALAGRDDVVQAVDVVVVVEHDVPDAGVVRLLELAARLRV